jgi:hypothetical protein
LEKWYYTKLWGLANGAGWGNEPKDYIEVITLIESEKNSIEAEEMEKRNASMQAKSGKKG